MDGIHDLGGRQGFGPIDVDEPEEQWHAQWEARTRCAINSMGKADLPAWNIDWFRHVREMMDPVHYLSRPYYDQWLQAYAAMMVHDGVATVEEIATGKSTFKPEGLSEPMRPEDVTSTVLGIRDFVRKIDQPPRYAAGDSIRTNEHGAQGHTRLPAYARGKTGVIEDLHDAHIFPDRAAFGEEVSEHLYTVSFALGDLFAESKGSKDRVALNLWESYLEPA